MKERIKIVFAINHLGMGGAENMLVEQVKHIDRAKFIPYVVTILPNPSVNLIDKLPKGIDFHSFNFSGLLDIFSFISLWRFLRREKVQVIVTNLFNTNLIGRVAAILAGVPIVFSYEHSIYRDKRTWQVVVDRILAKFTNKIIVGSTEVLNFTAQQEKLSLEKFCLNFNSIPLRFGRVKENRDEVLQDMDLSTKPIYIVTAGRLINQKGHKHLIEAVSIMKKKTAQDFKVLIFGQGFLKSDLKKQIELADLSDKVFLMGLDKMDRILSISDIFTMPSLWEGLSIALLEAMDAGCPIVGTKVSGTREAIINGESGLLVAPGESDRLAEALISLIDDEDMRIELSGSAKERVKKFSIESNIKVIENLVLLS